MSDNSREVSAGGMLLKVLGFSIGLTLLFTLVANTLPQVEGEAPVDEKVDLGALTMESFVALGESLFSGKGTCTLCHNDMGRAPDILKLNMVEMAADHLQDARYKGAATDAGQYLHESMVDPGNYVVQGFGKKGSNDTESPMPAIDKAPIQLSPVEIDAIIAFLQAKDGNPVTVALPSADTAAVTAVQAEAPTAPAVAATAAEALAKYSCTACHAL
ncbi:MAG: cytochrome C, partial [Gammaproteobacteria bacterium]|nr:cytochrome C [Gammaproteobacteria bacterium]